jgi:hypothetical protein
MKKMEFLVLALSMMVAMVAPALAAQNPEASQGSYDIAVYISGTDILAEDSNGQVISSGVAGTDDSRVIQTAVNAISDGTILLQAGTYTLSDSADVRVSNPEMGSLTVISTPSEARIYLDGADTGKATPYTFTGISPGVHNVSVELSGYTTPEPQTATVTAGGEATADIALEAEEPSDVQKPYAAHTVPGRINFADFDFGGEGVAYHDTTAGNQGDYAYRTDDADVDTGKRDAVNVPVVAHTYAGEWLSYSQVQVAESGTYDATFYTSTTEDGKSFSVLVDGKKVATVNVPNTGNWYTFGPTTVQIPLTAGEHTVKIAMDTGWVDMAYVEFAPAAPTPTPTPTPKPTPAPTPSSEYGADANPTGNPIGGGNGYTDIISRDDPRVKFIVDTRDELLSALQSARSGDVIYVEGNANIDMSGHFNIQVPAGVTIASNRGENGAAGGRIFQIRLSNDQAADWTPMFKAAGQNVRITGLRIEGPDKTTGSVGQTRLGIFSSYRNLEVDNCEIWGWSGAGVSLYGTGGSDMQSGGYVHHNYIHHCQMNGLGYGVVVSGGSTSLVEANYIDYCRHAIAGSGLPGDGYEARYNICGPNFIASYAYQFDMHGTPDPSGSGTMAGDIIKIHHNTFMATGPADSYAALICGIPRVGAYIDHNWFYYDQAPPIAQMNGKGKITMTDNLIGQKKVLYSSGPIRYW